MHASSSYLAGYRLLYVTQHNAPTNSYLLYRQQWLVPKKTSILEKRSSCLLAHILAIAHKIAVWLLFEPQPQGG